MNITKEEFCQRITKILYQLTYANSSIHIIESIDCFLSACDSNKDVLKKDINFWKVILDNCNYRVYAELAKIYEEDKQSMGLRKIINICEQHQSWFLNNQSASNVIEKLNNQYDSMNNLRIKLKAIRDQGLFHQDKKYILNLRQLVEDQKIELNDKKLLLHTAAEICNTILEHITGERKSIEVLFNDDARYILMDLKRLNV